jgi:hypothetical protein
MAQRRSLDKQSLGAGREMGFLFPPDTGLKENEILLDGLDQE